MNKLIMAGIAATLALGAGQAAAQTGNDSGIATETQERRSEGQDDGFPWDLLGLLGLAGLLGLRKKDDSHVRRTH